MIVIYSLPEICSQVCETVLGAIERVFGVMQLTEIKVSPAVLCPCGDKAIPHSACLHTARNKYFLQCSKTIARVGKAEDKHNDMMWLSNETKSTAMKAVGKSAGPSNQSSRKQGTTAPAFSSRLCINYCCD